MLRVACYDLQAWTSSARVIPHTFTALGQDSSTDVSIDKSPVSWFQSLLHPALLEQAFLTFQPTLQ